MSTPWVVSSPSNSKDIVLKFSKSPNSHSQSPKIIDNPSVAHNIVLTGIRKFDQGGTKRKAVADIDIIQAKDKKTKMDDNTKMFDEEAQDLGYDIMTKDESDCASRKKKKSPNKKKESKDKAEGSRKDLTPDEGCKKPDSTATSIEEVIKKSVSASEGMIDNKIKNIQSTLDASQDQMLKKIGETLQPLVVQVKGLEDRQKTLEFRQDSFEGNLKEELTKMKEEILTEVRSEQKVKTEATNLAAFRYSLCNEIEKESMKLLMFGVKKTDTEVGSHARNILSEIADKGKIKIDVKQVIQIGKTSEKGTTAVIIVLENSNQRNEILKNGKFIPEGITIDRCTPPAYRETYKKMKKRARSLSKHFGCQTQVSFANHTLQLRYREEGKSFTILEEFSPSPEDMGKYAKGNKLEGDSVIPSASINEESIAKAKRYIILNGLGKSTEEELRKWLQILLTENDYKDMTDLKRAGKFWNVGFKDEAKARYIAMTYKEKSCEGLTFKGYTLDI